jgi:hypothetical protein
MKIYKENINDDEYYSKSGYTRVRNGDSYYTTKIKMNTSKLFIRKPIIVDVIHYTEETVTECCMFLDSIIKSNPIYSNKTVEDILTGVVFDTYLVREPNNTVGFYTFDDIQSYLVEFTSGLQDHQHPTWQMEEEDDILVELGEDVEQPNTAGHTVAEVIEKLKTMDQDMIVHIEGKKSSYDYRCSNIEFFEITDDNGKKATLIGFNHK